MVSEMAAARGYHKLTGRKADIHRNCVVAKAPVIVGSVSGPWLFCFDE